MILLIFLSFLNTSYIRVFATEITSKNTSFISLKTKEITRKDFFIFIGELVKNDVRSSYWSIQLLFKDIKTGSKEYKALQKLVYLNLIGNSKTKLSLEKSVSALTFYKLAGKALWLDFTETLKNSDKRNAHFWDFDVIKEKLEEKEVLLKLPPDEITLKKEMFFDIYDTLTKAHYDKDTIDPNALLYSAMEWLTLGTWDKHTNFFPPLKNEGFQDTLSGKYEGIGAYVDMQTPWVVNIISPIAGSPAEKAGLKWKDLILKVGENTITEKNSLNEVVSCIKWPAWSVVVLEIQRGTEILKVEVKREKITIQEVTTKMFWSNTLYIQIRSFWDNTFSDFQKAITQLKDNKNINKIIFDLRNNPGGYLDVVNDMLGYFVKEGESVSVIKYHNYTLHNKSTGYTDIDPSKYTFIMLQNSGTASASEIMIGTIKDYFPNTTTVIGEKSYGKWSVQTLKAYEDGSSLKYTVAKWFTGKTARGIDGVGITPDKEVIPTDQDTKDGLDVQLQKAPEY